MTNNEILQFIDRFKKNTDPHANTLLRMQSKDIQDLINKNICI